MEGRSFKWVLSDNLDRDRDSFWVTIDEVEYRVSIKKTGCAFVIPWMDERKPKFLAQTKCEVSDGERIFNFQNFTFAEWINFRKD